MNNDSLALALAADAIARHACYRIAAERERCIRVALVCAIEFGREHEVGAYTMEIGRLIDRHEARHNRELVGANSVLMNTTPQTRAIATTLTGAWCALCERWHLKHKTFTH